MVSLRRVFDDEDDIESSIVVVGTVVVAVVVSMDDGRGAICVVGLDSIRFVGLSVDLFLISSMFFFVCAIGLVSRIINSTQLPRAQIMNLYLMLKISKIAKINDSRSK